LIALRHTAVHGWRTRRHIAHNTTDFKVADCAPLAALVEPLIARAVLPRLAALFFDATDATAAVHLEVTDLFFVKYDAAHQASLGAHRDGSLISFSIAMNAPDAFVGGVTFFAHSEAPAASAAAAATTATGARSQADDDADRAAVVVRPRAVGDLISHSGKLVHGGVAITAGRRYIVVGFVDARGGVIDAEFISSMSVAQARIDHELDWPLLCGAVGGEGGGGIAVCGLPWATELFRPDDPFTDVFHPYT
jgi:hypothetical protein